MHLDKYLDYKVSRKEKIKNLHTIGSSCPFPHGGINLVAAVRVDRSGHPEVESNRNGGEGAASALQEEFSCWPARGDS